MARNVRVLFWIPFLSETFPSKGFAVTSPESITGKNVRVFGQALPEFVKLCGGTPILVNGPDQYAAFKNGQVAAGITALDVFGTNKLWEVVDHVNIARPIHEEWVVIMNVPFWSSLDPDTQRILTEAGRTAEKSAREKVEQYDEEAVKVIASHGVAITRIGDDDVMGWKSCSSEIAENFLLRSDRLRRKVLDSYRKLLLSLN